MILMMCLLLGLFPHVLTIDCFTCSEADSYFCPVPLSIDAGEEHNENDIPSLPYDSGHVCESDHYIDPQTGKEKIILRGTKSCEPVNVPNHLRLCCDTDNCNKELPKMIIEPSIYANVQPYFPSILLILLSVVFSLVCVN